MCQILPAAFFRSRKKARDAHQRGSNIGLNRKNHCGRNHSHSHQGHIKIAVVKGILVDLLVNQKNIGSNRSCAQNADQNRADMDVAGRISFQKRLLKNS